MRRLGVALWVTLVAGMLLASSALASGASGIYTQVLHAYQTNGRIPPCQFSSLQLESALSGVDTYGQQYYADFIAAIDTALTARAGGACSGSHHQSAAASGPANRGAPPRTPSAPALPSSITAPTSSGLPLPMLLLIALGALLAAVVAAPRWTRARGREPLWVPSWRHGAAEARHRMEGAWLELRDRLRH